MQLSFIISLCLISTDVSHAYGNERSIGLGLRWQPNVNCTRSVYLLGKEDSAHDVHQEGMFVLSTSTHMPIVSVVCPLYYTYTYLSHAHANLGIGLGMCRQPTKQNDFCGKPSANTLLLNVLDTCKRKGSFLSTLGQGTDNENSMVTVNACAMVFEILLMELSHRSVWELFLEEEVDLRNEASVNCTRSVSFLGKEDIAHDVDREGIFVISCHKHMPIGSVLPSLYCIFTYLAHAYANQA